MKGLKMRSFKAKDIQAILGISKIRYEYLSRETAIRPDVEEVEGTGRAHRYSMKNLLQFRVADVALSQGFSGKQVRGLFESIDDYKTETKLDPFKNNESTDGLRVIYIGNVSGGCYVFDGPKRYALPYKEDGSGLNALSWEGARTIHSESLSKFINAEIQMGKFERGLNGFHSYSVINLGVLIRDTIERAKKIIASG
jgi:hypothetical protein